MARIKPLDLAQIQTDTVRRRKYRLNIEQLGGIPEPSAPLQEFFRGLPRVGRAAQLLAAAELLAGAALAHRPMIWLVDRQVIDAGVSAQLVYLMQRGLVQCLALNGEAAVRDYELAFHGCTDEDPEHGLADGRLGLARETGEGINAIVNEGVKRGFSLGECLGRGVLDRQPRNFRKSLLATGAARLTPTTIHLTLGADGFHRYPGADGALLGKGSLKDAHMLGSYLSGLPAEALVVSTHSDPTLTQVFLNALGLGKNLNEALTMPHLLTLGEGDAGVASLPGGKRALRLEGPLELTMPLLLGALFSLVE